MNSEENPDISIKDSKYNETNEEIMVFGQDLVSNEPNAIISLSSPKSMQESRLASQYNDRRIVHSLKYDKWTNRNDTLRSNNELGKETFNTLEDAIRECKYPEYSEFI